MSSSGLRHGAVNILKLRDFEKIEKYNIYQIIAYRKGKKYSYKTFCTPECTTLIDSYLNYRKHAGEQLKSNSPLIREQFNTNDKLKVNNSRHLTSKSIRYMVNDIVRGHYMKPDINTFLEGTKEVKGYLAAIDSLTINNENKLSKQVQKLVEKDDYNNYIIDKKINDLTSRLNQYEEIEKEGRIMSKEHAQRFADLAKKNQCFYG